MKIVISIPAYNEEKTLPFVLKDIRKAMKDHKYDILVVNDGSADKTAEVARKAGAKVVSHKRNRGLAETFKTEVKTCIDMKADVIVHTDADGQYPAKYIPQLIAKVEQGYDLVLGSRFGKGKYSGSISKRFGNLAFARVFSGLLKTKVTDTTTGFRAFTREVAELPIINSFTYTQEQLIRSGKAKLKIGEVSITTRKTRDSRLFKSSFTYASKAWINILRIYRDFEPLAFFGKIGMCIFSAGFIIGLWLLYLFVTTSAIGGHDASAILSMLLITVGIQTVIFGFLADMLK